MLRRTGAALVITAVCGALLVAMPGTATADDDTRPLGRATEEVRGGDPTPHQTRAQARERSMELATAGKKRGRHWLRKRFAREKARFGDRDRSPRNMHHVHELQYRLRWANAYKGPVTGYFGKKTRKAVRRFQRRMNIKRTGVANRKTWRKLIRRSIRARKRIPKRCKSNRSRGIHVCYDRRRHQVTFWRGGKLRNAWLVRGGSRRHKTRTGNFRVYYRNKDHVSSIYNSPMPNAQFFSGGQAFHGSPYMIDPFKGHSHGCVNMYLQDARQLWKMTKKKRVKVHIYGRWS